MAFVFGRRPVLELLTGETPIHRLLVANETKGPIIDRIIKSAKEKKIIVLRVPRHQIESMFPNCVHQGVVAEQEADYIFNYSLDYLLEEMEKKTTSAFVLILDGIVDPRNLGALIRTANAAGINGVIIPKHRSAGITPLVVKTSAGAIESTPVIQVTNLIQTCHILKNKGIWIIGTDFKAKDLWFQIDMTSSLALVLGGEEKGIRRLLREECDFMIKLPMLGKVESLNVSVAGGILMYEVLRQRINIK